MNRCCFVTLLVVHIEIEYKYFVMRSPAVLRPGIVPHIGHDLALLGRGGPVGPDVGERPPSLLGAASRSTNIHKVLGLNLQEALVPRRILVFCLV